MYIIVIVLLLLFSTQYLDLIHRYLKKIKKIKNILLLLFSIGSIVSYKYIPTKHKRKLTDSNKKYVAANQKWLCNHCKQTLDHTYEIDHKIALYKGGSNDMNNLQALCRNCHGKKTFNDNIGL